MTLVAGLVVAVPGHAVAVGGDSSGVVITMFSQPGDYIGLGSAQEFDRSNTTVISKTLSTSRLRLYVSGGTSPNFWDVEIDPPPGTTFQTGYYRNAQRAGFRTGAHPGLAISGAGRGCNTVTGSFEVRDLLTSGGVITRLDVLYEQHCEGKPAALFGEIRINEPQTSGLVVSSQAITWPAAGLGATGVAVPVYVRNLGDTNVPVGSTAVVSDPSEFPVRSDGCSGKTLPPGEACELAVGFTPTSSRGPRTASLHVSLGSMVDSVQLDGLTSAGSTSLVMHSERGDWVGQGGDYDFTSADATFWVRGGPYALGFRITEGDELWSVDLVPRSGEILAPGYYGSATRAASSGFGNGLDITGDSRGCLTITGSFTVTQAVFSPVDDSLQHLAVSFIQHCDGSSAALTGTLSYNYAPVVSPPAGVSGLTASWSGSNILVTWLNPTSTDYRYTVIRLERGTPLAESPVGGTAVYQGAGTSAEVTGLVAGETFTVTAFSVDQYGNVSNPVNVPVAPPYSSGGPLDAVVTAFSDPGDFVGQGTAAEFDPSNATVRGTVSTSLISLDVSGGTSGTAWAFYFVPPSGTTFHAGYYDAQRPWSGLPGLAGLDISVTGRGCNSDSGSFEVRDLHTSGTVITRLDLLYEQHCEGQPPALWGEIRVNEPHTTGFVASAQSITWPALGLGASGTAVPVYVRNLTDTDIGVGSAQVVDDPAEFPVRSDGCSGQTLPPGGACVLYVAFVPSNTRGPRTAWLQVPLGNKVDEVQLDGLVSVGATSLIMHSQPGDWVGGGDDYDFTPADATFWLSGGPDGIKASVMAGAEYWQLDMTPATGEILAPGYTGNGIDVSGDLRACNTSAESSFTITQAVFSPVDGSLHHLAASFTQYCAGSSAALTGTLTYNYAPVVTAAGVSGLTATTSGPDRVSVGWVNPSSPDYRYTVIRVEQGVPSAESPTAGTAVYQGAGTDTTVTGLIAGKTYTVTAFAVDQYGNVSDPSNAVVIAGGRLAGLAFKPGVTTAPSLRVSWSPSSVPATATGIRVCLQPATAAVATPTSCASGTIKDLVPSASYATFRGLASGKAYRATVWPDYHSATVFGAAASKTIAGSSFINPASTTTAYGSALTLSTKLKVAGTRTALGSAPVTLWARKAASSAWTKIAARTTSSSGIASVTVKPTVNTAYQWRYPGTGTHMSAVGLETIRVD